MLFVSKYAAYRHVISPGTMRWVRDPSGAERQVDNGDFFWAEFKLGGLLPHQQDLALQEFRKISPINPLGAEPMMVEGAISMLDAAEEGETSNVHEGFNPYQRLSRYDTEDGRMCPQRWKESAEETLLASTDFGRDFLRIDLAELTIPWASYDTMPPADIPMFALAGGFDIDYVIRYEAANQARLEVGKALRAAQKQQQADAAERAKLTVNA
jgi:hypothetical protein